MNVPQTAILLLSGAYPEQEEFRSLFIKQGLLYSEEWLTLPVSSRALFWPKEHEGPDKSVPHPF